MSTANRKPSKFEVYHHLSKLRRDITELLLRDFGYSFPKSEKRLKKRFGGRNYEELDAYERQAYDRIKTRWAAFEEWFIVDQRKIITDCLREITKHVYMANSIYPTCMAEYEQRRMHQNEAIGYCYDLEQELQYAIETLPVDVNAYTRFSAQIDKQITLIKAWRKADNKLKANIKEQPPSDTSREGLLDRIINDIAERVQSKDASSFANVNSNGNANNNGASNANGVRPDFDSAAKDK